MRSEETQDLNTPRKHINRLSVKIKKAIAVVCTAALLAGTVPVISSSVITANAQNAIYARAVSSLNLRSGMGMHYKVVEVISKNASLVVLDRSNKSWIRVKTSNGHTGYCAADYLDVTTDAKATTFLNVRKGPSTNYASIKTIVPGTKLDILKFCGASWLNVKLMDGTVGYVCNEFDYVQYLPGTSTDTKVKTNAEKSSSSSQTESKTVTVSISANSKSLDIGNSFTLVAKTTSGGTFNWKSSDKNIATATSKGLVTAVKPGKATITANDSKSSKSVSCTVTVVKPSIQSINLSSKSGTLTVGQSFTLKPSVKPSNGKVAYSTSNSSIATVTSAGVIKAVKPGSATITVKDAQGGKVSATYKVIVVSKPTISISASSASVKAGANYKLSAKLSNNAWVKWTSSNTNVAAVRGGVVSGIGAGTATITASDSSGSVKATCKVTVTGVSSYGVSLSRYSGNVTAGKTLYIKGYSSSYTWWNSSDTSIATVSEGFILGKNPGKCAITLTDANGNRAICAVTVYESNSVKFTYSSPNSAVRNQNVKLIAITDKKRTAVRFEVNVNGKNTIINASEKYSDGNTYVWTGYYKPTFAGTFKYSAYAKTGNKWITCNDGKADIYVTDKTDKKTTAIEKLRASDDVIRFIGDKEGFVSNITYDTLANNLPTLAHGYVVWEGDTFYNGLTRNEGYALLVKAVNTEVYTSTVNSMLITNNIRFNQQQFDALVSFSYNLGTGWTYSSDLKNILLNSYGNVTTSSGNSMKAVVNVSDGLNLRESYTTNSKILDVLESGETVTLLSTQKYNSVWYKVKTSNGKTGYCSGTYLTIGSSSSRGRDLNYVNKNALIRELLAYHHAGGVCYWGLLYRRVDEAEMFIYGDYEPDGRSNKHNFPSTSCLPF